MKTHHIRSAVGGWQVYHHDGWGHLRLDGPVWPTGKQARDYVDALDIAAELETSPLRGSGEESPDGLVLPQPQSVVDSSPDSRERRRPARRGR